MSVAKSVDGPATARASVGAGQVIATYGFVAHWATHGQRDFASASAIVAARYDLTVGDALVERAR